MIEAEFKMHDNMMTYLRRKLSNGDAIILIDECSFSDLSIGDILSDVADFMGNYSRCQYVIFRSRDNAALYAEFSAFQDIPRFELARLSAKKMREMSDKYSRAYASVFDARAFKFDTFIASLKEMGLFELSEKPYWFGLLFFINAVRSGWPENAVSAHSLVADDMLNRLLSTLTTFSDAERLCAMHAFELIACKLLAAADGGTVVPRHTIMEALEKYVLSDKAALLMTRLRSNECEFIYRNSN